MRVPFPTSLGKESRRTCRTSRGGALNLLVERNSGVVPPFQKTPMSQSSPDTPDSPALTRLSRRISTQNMMAIVTALWHLKRKPQIPMATRQHFLCCLFWDPHTPQQRTEREIERSPSLTSKSTQLSGCRFSIEILVQVSHLGFFRWLSL